MRIERKGLMTQGFLGHGVDLDFKFRGKPLEVLSSAVMLFKKGHSYSSVENRL